MVLNKLKIISPIAGCLVRIAHVQTCFYASQNRNSWPRLMLPDLFATGGMFCTGAKMTEVSEPDPGLELYFSERIERREEHFVLNGVPTRLDCHQQCAQHVSLQRSWEGQA